jgi:hypothetical protein
MYALTRTIDRNIARKRSLGMSVNLLLAAVAAFSSSAVFANIYQYRLPKIPSQELCAELNAGVVERIRSSGAAIIDASCNRDGSRVQLVVDYSAESELALVSTAKPQWSSIDFPGYAETEEACLATLAEQSDLFAAQTTLTPHAAYCTQDAEDDLWYARVDAFGESEITPQISGFYTFGRILQTEAEFRATIASAAERSAFPLAGVGLRPSIGMMRISLTTYGTERRRSELVEELRLPSEEQCEEAVVAIQEIAPHHALFCTYVSITGAFEVNVLALGAKAYATYSPTQAYENFAACDADKQRVRDQFNDRLPGGVLYVGCTATPEATEESEIRAVIFHGVESGR